MRLLIFALAGFLSSAFHIANAEPLRIGFITSDIEQGCYSGDDIPSQDAMVYAEHLQKRFSSTISLCFSPSADAFSASDIDMMWGRRAELAAFQQTHRPFLTGRSSGTVGRVPVVVFTTVSNASSRPQDLRGKRVAYSGKEPVSLNRDMALAVLSDFEIDAADVSLVSVVDRARVADAVRSGDANYGVLEVSSWARNCNVYRSDQKDCSDLSVVFTSRPRADVGMIIRRDISKEIRYRMVGVHAHMHYEEPRASSWVLGDREARFEPLEPEAFTIGTSAGGR